MKTRQQSNKNLQTQRYKTLLKQKVTVDIFCSFATDNNKFRQATGRQNVN